MRLYTLYTAQKRSAEGGRGHLSAIQQLRENEGLLVIHTKATLALAEAPKGSNFKSDRKFQNEEQHLD